MPSNLHPCHVICLIVESNRKSSLYGAMFTVKLHLSIDHRVFTHICIYYLYTDLCLLLSLYELYIFHYFEVMLCFSVPLFFPIIF